MNAAVPLLPRHLADDGVGIERADVLDDGRRRLRQRLAQVGRGRRQLDADERRVVADGVDDARALDAVLDQHLREKGAIGARDLARRVEDERRHVGVGIEQPLAAVDEHAAEVRAQLDLPVHARALERDRLEAGDGLERAHRRLGQLGRRRKSRPGSRRADRSTRSTR